MEAHLRPEYTHTHIQDTDQVEMADRSHTHILSPIGSSKNLTGLHKDSKTRAHTLNFRTLTPSALHSLSCLDNPPPSTPLLPSILQPVLLQQDVCVCVCVEVIHNQGVDGKDGSSQDGQV